MMEQYRALREKYYPKILLLTLGLVLCILVLQRFFPALQDFVVDIGVIGILTFVFVLDLGNSISRLERKMSEVSRTKYFSEQVEAIPCLIDYIDRTKPLKVKMLEYSAATVHDLLLHFRKTSTEIKLLIQHPDAAISTLQKKRISTNILNLLDIEMINYPKLEIRCYKHFPSLRGRKLDDKIICVGWYTPTKRIKGGILGHGNPIILANLQDENGRILGKMFDEVFDYLWENGVPVEEVYQKIKSALP